MSQCMFLSSCWDRYCSSDDETVIEKGVQNVKRILADNFVRLRMNHRRFCLSCVKKVVTRSLIW